MADAEPMRVAVAIVGFRNRDDILACLTALAASTYPDFLVVICENGGEAAHAALAEALAAPPLAQEVRLLRSPANVGYAGGVNACIAAAPDADAWWILNPDTSPEPGALAALDAKDPLRPHALVHVCVDGTIHLPHTAPKRILDSMRKLARLDPAQGEALWRRFDRETREGLRMERWQALLEAAIVGITGTAQERAVDSLFTTGAPQGMSGASGLDDWEVIAWFPILSGE